MLLMAELLWLFVLLFGLLIFVGVEMLVIEGGLKLFWFVYPYMTVLLLVFPVDWFFWLLLLLFLEIDLADYGYYGWRLLEDECELDVGVNVAAWNY